jgi:hypothetical protein
MQVLEDQQKRLLTRFAQWQLPECVKRATAPLPRVECLPRGIVHGHIEQCQQRQMGRLEGRAEAQEAARHLLSYIGKLVSVLNPEVPPEEIDDWQVARRLAIRDRAGLQHAPAMHAMRVGELPD